VSRDVRDLEGRPTARRDLDPFSSAARDGLVTASAEFARRLRRPLLAASVVAASFVGAAEACVPSIDFENGGSGDSGTDAPTADATHDASDGGVDARADVTVDASPDAATDSAPADAAPDVVSTRSLMASSDFWGYASTAACAVRGGTLYCWGDPQSNMFGQLGFPDEDAGGLVGILNPTAVTTTAASPSQILQIVMAEYSTCALYGATPYCWGSNQSAQIGNPNDVNGGSMEFAVQGVPAAGLTSLAAADITVCGIGTIQDAAANESNIYCWGDNGYGELGRPVDQGGASMAEPVTGNLDGGPLGVIPNAVAIAGGGAHFCALTSTSRIFCWGSSDFFECGPGEAGTDCPGRGYTTCTAEPLEVPFDAGGDPPIELALGEVHSCVLTQSGNVYCWGANDDYELGSAASPQYCTYDGDAGCSSLPLQVVGLSGIQRIFAGGRVTCALDASRHAFCWGDDQFGQLGLGPYNGQTYITPTQLLEPVTGNPYTFDEIVIGAFSACARDGTDYYCWGAGVLGTQDADGGAPSSMSPEPVQF
jgi:alpha-tubulin suppressor-like RCC1 family protein